MKKYFVLSLLPIALLCTSTIQSYGQQDTVKEEKNVHLTVTELKYYLVQDQRASEYGTAVVLLQKDTADLGNQVRVKTIQVSEKEAVIALKDSVYSKEASKVDLLTNRAEKAEKRVSRWKSGAFGVAILHGAYFIWATTNRQRAIQ